MQIKSLTIEDYKCLVDFKLQFEIAKNRSCSILIGENGTGKSTMLEVISQIFMSFDSSFIAKSITFSYEIEYFYAGQFVIITFDGNKYKIVVDKNYIYTGTRKTILKKLAVNNKRIFPNRIVTYYSGLNDKLLSLYNKLTISYKKAINSTVNKYLTQLKHPEKTSDLAFPHKKYIFCDDKMTGIYLCAILGASNPSDSFEKKYLSEQCNIHSIANIDIEIDMKKIFAFYRKDFSEQLTTPTELLTIIEFIDDRMVSAFEIFFIYSSKSKVFFSLNNLQDLKMDASAILNFFEKLSTLFDVKYNIKVLLGDSIVNINDLSEGQRQLIKLFGMLGVCKAEDCLVLMDEPDAHMNPKWKYNIKSLIDRSLEKAINTQAIIATHDPLVINGVDKKFIRIFEYNCNIIKNNNFYLTKVIVPNENTKGLGIDGLLQSSYYGLQSSYDKETSDEFLERQKLYIKLINKEISQEEKERLKNLTLKLSALPISYNTIDFLYDDFISEFRNSKYYSKEYLTYDETEKRRKEIQDIISKLYEE